MTRLSKRTTVYKEVKEAVGAVVDVVARVLAAVVVVVVVVAVVPSSCAGALIDSVLTVAAAVPYVQGVAVYTHLTFLASFLGYLEYLMNNC